MMSLPRISGFSVMKGLEASLFKGISNRIGRKQVEAISEETMSKIGSIAKNYKIDQAGSALGITASLTAEKIRENFPYLGAKEYGQEVSYVKSSLGDKVNSVLSLNPLVLFYKSFEVARSPEWTAGVMAYGRLMTTNWRGLPEKLRNWKRNREEMKAIRKWQIENGANVAASAIVHSLENQNEEEAKTSVYALLAQYPGSVISKGIKKACAYYESRGEQGKIENLNSILLQVAPDKAPNRSWWDKHKWKVGGAVFISLGIIAAGGLQYLARQREEERLKSDEDKDGLTLREELEYGSDPTKPNPALKYAAKDVKLAKDVSTRLIVLDKEGKSELDPSNKALVDYLYNISQSEVVSSEVLKLVPTEYRDSVVRALQTKVLDDLLVDGKVTPEEVNAINLLYKLGGAAQRMRIENGLSDTSVKQLALLYQNPDEQFRRWAAEQNLFTEDGVLDADEITLLARGSMNPTQANLELIGKLQTGYIKPLKESGDPVISGIASQWEQLPEYGKDWKTLEATEDLRRQLSESKPISMEDGLDPSKITRATDSYQGFELMGKGGVPDQKDFGYPVPRYNTQLRVFRSLAEANEFLKNDTTAIAIALDNGLWITMGTDEVAQTVLNRDAPDMLSFLRQDAEMQKALGFHYNLEDYGLAEKVCLAWRQNSIIAEGGKDIPHAPLQYLWNGKKIDLRSYEWFTVSLETLDKMRDVVIEKWMDKSGNVDNIVGNLEFYFYFNNANPGDNGSTNWINGLRPETYIDISGEKVLSHNFYNINWLFDYFLRTGKGIGVCGDEAALVDGFSKSVGIPTNHRFWHGSGYGHTHITYFNPQTQTWKAYSWQSDMALKYVGGKGSDVMMLRMPINQREYFKPDSQSGYLKLLSVKKDPSTQDLTDIYGIGLSSEVMKKLLLYY